MLPGYELIEETPDVETYRALRVAAGMTPRSAAGASAGLPSTLFAAVVRFDGRIVGMGRIVGDGGCCFVVTDMAVEPVHQGRGVGKAIFARLVEWLHANVPESAHISLQADGDARYLYAKFGFVPIEPAAIGMELFIR